MKKTISLSLFLITVSFFYFSIFGVNSIVSYCNAATNLEYIDKSNIVMPSQLTAGKVDIIAGLQIDSVFLGKFQLPLNKIKDISVAFLIVPVQYAKESIHITVLSNGLTIERDIPVMHHENTVIDVSKIVFSEATSKIKSKENEEQIKAENIKISRFFQLNTVQKFSLPFKYPVESPTILSQFGKKRDYYNEKGKYLYSSYHSGLDFRANNQTFILSSAEGIVVFAEYSITRGNAIYIDHGLGIFTSYFHLSKLFVKEGDSVTKGFPLAAAGSTGLSTAEHLHWGVIINSTNIDGLSLLEVGDRLTSAAALLQKN